MQSTAEDSFSHLTRLAQRPGVQSTLILSRDTGAIVSTTGLVSREDSVETSNGNTATDESKERGLKSAEDVARLVWNFVKAAGGMVQELNGTPDDELKLLRLRTRKNELVIVPDAKFIAVVIHDTPPA